MYVHVYMIVKIVMVGPDKPAILGQLFQAVSSLQQGMHNLYIIVWHTSQLYNVHCRYYIHKVNQNACA